MDSVIPMIILAVFAVFGLYCLVRLLCDSLSDRNAAVATFVTEKEDIYMLPERLYELRHSMLSYSGSTLVLVPHFLMEDPETEALLLGAVLGFDTQILVYESETPPSQQEPPKS